jgi:hypothetical protein
MVPRAAEFSFSILVYTDPSPSGWRQILCAEKLDLEAHFVLVLLTGD